MFRRLCCCASVISTNVSLRFLLGTPSNKVEDHPEFAGKTPEGIFRELAKKRMQRLENAQQDVVIEKVDRTSSNTDVVSFVGIDLGTSNSCLSYIDEATLKPKIIPSPSGSWVFPTVIVFDKRHQSRIFGEDARAVLRSGSASAVTSGKRLIGRRQGEMGGFRSEFQKTQEIVTNERGEPAIVVKGRTYTVVHITAMFLRHLKKEAELFLGKPVEQCVVSVPAYFTPQQKVTTEDAALIAGFDVLEVIDEPSAAGLAFSFINDVINPQEHKTEEELCLVFDLGGGTLDCALLRHNNKTKQSSLIANYGDSQLGGNDWDNILARKISSDFEKKWRLSLEDPTANPGCVASDQRILMVEAEKAKIHFTRKGLVDYIGFQRNFHMSEKLRDLLPLEVLISVDEYADLTRPLRTRCLETVRKLLEKAAVRASDVDRVLLVGAMTRDPLVRKDLSEYFNKPLSDDTTCPADYVVAMGAAIRGGMLHGMFPELIQHTRFVWGSDQAARSVGILKRCALGLWHKLIKSNSQFTANTVGKRWRGSAKGLPESEIVEFAKELVEFEATEAKQAMLDDIDTQANAVMRRVIQHSDKKQGNQDRELKRLAEQVKFWHYYVRFGKQYEDKLLKVCKQLTAYMDELEGVTNDGDGEGASSSKEIREDGTIDFSARQDDEQVTAHKGIDLPNVRDAEALRTIGHRGFMGYHGSVLPTVKEAAFRQTVEQYAEFEIPAPQGEHTTWKEAQESLEKSTEENSSSPLEHAPEKMNLAEQLSFLEQEFPLEPLTSEEQEHRDLVERLSTIVVDVPPVLLPEPSQ